MTEVRSHASFIVFNIRCHSLLLLNLLFLFFLLLIFSFSFFFFFWTSKHIIISALLHSGYVCFVFLYVFASWAISCEHICLSVCLTLSICLILAQTFLCPFTTFLPRCMECRRSLAMRILSVRLSVRLSVCQTRALWQNGRKIGPYFCTVRKII